MARRIGYVTKGAQVASEASSAAVTLPNGIEVGDLLLMWVVGRPLGTAGSNDTISVNNSWAQYGSRVRFEVGTADLSGELWYKVATSTEVSASPSAPTVTVGSNFQGSTAGWCAEIVCVTGVDAAIWDATGVTSTNAAAATRQPTGITTATANAVVLSFVGTADDNALAFNTANGFTLLYGGANYDTTSGADMAAGCAMKEITSPGAATCPTWSQTAVGNDAWVAMTVALKPDQSTSWDIEETWLKTDASSWGPVESWSTYTESDGVVSTQEAQGQITCGTGGGYGAGTYGIFDASAESADYGDLWLRMVVQSVSEHYVTFWWRDNGGAGNYYRIQISYGAFAQVDVVWAGSFTEHALVTANTSVYGGLAVGDVLHLRVSQVGSAMKLRGWKNNAAEPSTWNLLDTTETNITAAGNLTIGVWGGAASASIPMRFVDFRVNHSAPSATQTIGAATVSVASSLVVGAVTASGTSSIGAVTLSAALSLSGGAVTPAGAANIASATVEATTAILAGAVTASGTATIGAATMSASVSLVPGTVTGAGVVSISEATLDVAASIAAGAVTASGSATVDAATVSAASSVVAGSITGAGTASIGPATTSAALSLIPGAVTAGAASIGPVTLVVGSSLVAGAVTASGAAPVGAVVVELAASIIAGNVSAGGSLINATTIVVASSIIAGAVTATGTAQVGPVVLELAASVVAGDVSATGAAPIGEATVTGVLSLLAGAISSGAASIGPATVEATATILAGAVTGSGAVSIGPATVSVSATIVAGSVTATSAAQIGPTTITASTTILAGAVASSGTATIAATMLTLEALVIAGRIYRGGRGVLTGPLTTVLVLAGQRVTVEVSTAERSSEPIAIGARTTT